MKKTDQEKAARPLVWEPVPYRAGLKNLLDGCDAVGQMAKKGGEKRRFSVTIGGKAAKAMKLVGGTVVEINTSKTHDLALVRKQRGGFKVRASKSRMDPDRVNVTFIPPREPWPESVRYKVALSGDLVYLEAQS